MNIAAEINGTELTVFIEDSTWKKTTLPFNKELAIINLIVFMRESGPVSYDAVSKSEHITDPSLMFCQERITVAGFKKNLKKVGFNEAPYEISLSNERFRLKKVYKDAYTLTFMDYSNNPVFADWLVRVVPVLDAGMMLKRLREGGRYYTKDFAGFSEFANLKRFIEHCFELWHNKAVKDFEDAVANGTACCEGCEQEHKSNE